MKKVQLQSIWKLFGPNPVYTYKNLDHTLSRAELLAQTGHVIAVRNVSLEVEEGEIFVVMGLSGSGKSTLIRCLSRLIEPTAGSVLINGQNVTEMDDAALRHIRRHKVSMVFQRFGLFPHRRVVDNVAYGLEVRGEEEAARMAHALEIVNLVGLGGWENHYPHELSGGMQQRVGLARALAVDPEILLCDEPFSALDPLIRRDMQNELLNLQKSLHKTIIFITHDFLEALKIGDRIAIMKDGVIVQVGTPQQIVAQPADAYVRDFTQDVPRAKVLTAESIMQPVVDENAGAETAVSCHTTLEALIPKLAQSNGSMAVIDQEGVVVGTLNQQMVLAAMAEGA